MPVVISSVLGNRGVEGLSFGAGYRFKPLKPLPIELARAPTL